MNRFDLVLKSGTVVTAHEILQCDVGIRDGLVAALEPGLAAGVREIDARGRLVLPGGVDSHCHVEQLSSFGIMCADDFYSATVSAAFGGTTTIIPFCAQHRSPIPTSKRWPTIFQQRSRLASGRSKSS